MKRRLLFTFILLVISGTTPLFAQTSYETQCTLTIEEIQNQQTWGIDDPESEFTRDIAMGIFAELAIINDKLNTGPSNDLAVNLQAIATYINEADQLGMNYSMFETDLTFIETLN